MSLKSTYMKDKISRLSKFAQHQEIKALLKKKDKNNTESSDFSDDTSIDGNDNNLDFLITPDKCKTKLKPFTKQPFTKYEGNKKRPKQFSSLSVPPKKSKKQKENTEEDGNSNNNQSDSENKTLLHTVKRDQKDIENYYLNNKNFQDFEHSELETETEQLSWENLVSKTKEEIKNELTKIFGSATAVEKVPYLGRMRDRFPCPVTACRFNNVDPATHLCQTPMVKLSSKTSSELFQHKM